MNSPKVSIVMSVYNGDKCLEETVESILNQTFKDFEFIITNDGSTDKTPEVLGEYVKKDRRVRTITNPQNIGLTRSLNKGIRQAKGKYIARIDSGDVWKGRKLELQVESLEHHPETILLGTQATLVDEQKNTITKTTYPIDDKNIRLWLLRGANPFVHSSVIFKRGFLYDERFYKSQDFELWTRLFFEGRLANMKEALVYYYISTNSLTYTARPQHIYCNYITYNRFVRRLKKDQEGVPSNFLDPVVKPSLSILEKFFTFFYKHAYRIRKYNTLTSTIVLVLAYIVCPKLFFIKIKHQFNIIVNFLRYRSKIIQLSPK